MHPDCAVIDATALKRAIANLRTYCFVGLTEKHFASVELAYQLLPTHFSWAASLLANNETVRANVNTRRSRVIDPDVQATLLGVGHDHVLYKEAQRLFAHQQHCQRQHPGLSPSPKG